MSKKDINLAMESPVGGEDTYEAYEPDSDAFYENTRVSNAVVSTKPPITPKPKNVPPTDESYTDYRGQEDYLTPRKTTVKEEKVPLKATEEKRALKLPQSMGKKPQRRSAQACQCSRKCKIVVCVSISAIVGVFVIVGFVFMVRCLIQHQQLTKPAVIPTLDQKNFFLGEILSYVVVHLTPQHHGASVSVEITPSDQRSKVYNLRLTYDMDIALGKSYVWSETENDFTSSYSITSNGSIAAVMGFTATGIEFIGDTTLLLPKSAMGTDYTVLSKNHSVLSNSRSIPGNQALHIFSGESQSTKLRLTPSSRNPISPDIEFLDFELEAFRSLVQFDGIIDFTGLKISADHPISVMITQYTAGEFPSNMEMVYPDKLLGEKLYVPDFYNRNKLVRIMAVSPDTDVEIAGRNTTDTLQVGQFKDISEVGSLSITCTKVCSAVAFMEMQDANNPQETMVVIPPEKLFLSGQVYFSADLKESNYPIVNLAILVENMNGANVNMELNGNTINTTWNLFADEKYLGASINSIEHGTNLLDSKGLKFMAYLYADSSDDTIGAFAHVIGVNV